MKADNFHRLTKVLADSGESPTLEAAANTFASYGVRIVLGARIANSIVDQVIALTVINTAARSFLGNVEVVAPLGLQLTAPGFEGQTLTNFLDWAGVKKALPAAASGWPTIEVGEPGQSRTSGIRAWADGWTYGIGAHDGGRATFFAPACVAAAGLAVSEAFSVLRRDNPYAGRRSLSLSLWKPELTGDVAEAQGPAGALLPSVWLVGLGHLGQAYAWTMGFMKSTAGTEVFLQDIDVVTRSTLSTSVLSNEADLGRQKTRVAAAWLETRSFTTRLVERRFDGVQRVASLEPRASLTSSTPDWARGSRTSERCASEPSPGRRAQPHCGLPRRLQTGRSKPRLTGTCWLLGLTPAASRCWPRAALAPPSLAAWPRAMQSQPSCVTRRAKARIRSST
jgi:hypothetical protein